MFLKECWYKSFKILFIFSDISKSQYQDLILLLENMERMSQASVYRKYRPNVSSVHGNAAAWLVFPKIHCIFNIEAAFPYLSIQILN